FLMKSKQSKEIGRLALGPGIFNVNEPVLFGMPIVLNATILIPWISAPLIVTTLNYFVMAAGIVPAPTGVAVPWTVPIVINGILATNSWLGGALQVVDFFIVLIIWYPFLTLVDRTNIARESEAALKYVKFSSSLCYNLTRNGQTFLIQAKQRSHWLSMN
ncbi:PTS transporter subunit EIIC, partial [Escherichia coli]|uniref:PTS transporter subunit EIIC n=1 Tax=Escherichia coli TaxID=562 RepID=UPI001BCA0EE6